MESKTNSDRINQILQEAKNYFNFKLDLFTLNFNQKLASLMSYFLAFYALLFLILLFIFFLSFAFVFWWEENVGKIQYGFLIVSFLYLFLGIAIFRFRRKLILKPIIKFISSMFDLFHDESDDEDENGPIRNLEDLLNKKESVRNKMEEAEKSMQKNVDEIAQRLTPQFLIHKYSEKLGDKISDKILESDTPIGGIARKMKSWLDYFGGEEQEDHSSKEEEKDNTEDKKDQ